MPVRPVSHANTHTPTQPIYDAARQRDQHQLGLIVHDHGGAARVGQVAPHDLIGPVLVAGDERNIIRVAKTLIAQRGGMNSSSVFLSIALIVLIPSYERYRSSSSIA
jgi:hypothetical protein